MNADKTKTDSLSAFICVHPRLILALLLLFGFVGHVLYVAIDPPITLAGDEAHYWDWSRQLDWSYYSKGPAVAFLIRGSCSLFGETELAVRLPAMVLAVGTSLCTWWLTRRIFQSENVALGAVALTYIVPMYVAGSMLMTIDSPFYFCWAMATCFGYLAAVENKKWAWPAAGVFVGLGFLAKYASLLWLVGLIVFLRIHRRQVLATVWPWVTVGISFAFTAPVLIWNAHHDWVSFGHVARSTSEDQSHFNPLSILANLGELVGGQIGLLNPIVFGLMVAAIVHALRRDRNERTGYLLSIGLPFFGFVALVTLRKNTEPNWPAPTYFTLIPLTAAYVARGLSSRVQNRGAHAADSSWGKRTSGAEESTASAVASKMREVPPDLRGWLTGAIVIGLCTIVLLHESHWFYRIIKLPPRKWDPSARLVGWDEIGQAVSAEQKALGPDTMVIADKYQLAGLMAFYVDGHPKTFCLGSYLADPKERDRLTQYNLWPDRDLSQPALHGRNAVFVGHSSPDLYAAFDRIEALPELPIVRHGVTIRTQSIYRCYGFHGITRPTDGLTKR